MWKGGVVPDGRIGGYVGAGGSGGVGVCLGDGRSGEGRSGGGGGWRGKHCFREILISGGGPGGGLWCISRRYSIRRLLILGYAWNL